MASKTAAIDSSSIYSFVLGIEENFEHTQWVKWFDENWHIPYLIAIAFYLPVIYFGQIIMQKREPFNLKGPMMLWNGALAAFSIIGFARVAPEFFHSLLKHGFQHSVCSNSYINVKPTRFWIFLFITSKIPELGDTFFLVLRKQKLIFLHVYHHATVLIFSWFVFSNSIAPARWFCTMNFGVHAIMYTYYVLKALPNLFRVPKWISMLITSMQTVQMVVGAYVATINFQTRMTGGECATSLTMVLCGLGIYLSYLVLFSHFFYKSYCAPRPPKDASVNGSTAITKKKV